MGYNPRGRKESHMTERLTQRSTVPLGKPSFTNENPEHPE